MTTQTTALSGLLRRFASVPLRRQTYRNLAYLMLAFPLGLAYFIGVSIGVSLGAGLFITWLGIPILVATLAGATAIAGVEAMLVRRLLNIDVELPIALQKFDRKTITVRPTEGAFTALKQFLFTPTTWTAVLLAGVKFVFGVVAFTALVTASSLVGSMLAAPFLYDAPFVTFQFGSYVVNTLPDALALFVGGILLAFSALHVLNAFAQLGGILTAMLLNVTGRLTSTTLQINQLDEVGVYLNIRSRQPK